MRTIRAGLFCILLLFPLASFAEMIGPYAGTIIDSETGKPVVGASVLVYSERRVVAEAQVSDEVRRKVPAEALLVMYDELIAAQFTSSDSQGRYAFAGYRVDLPPSDMLQAVHLIIYRPGYQAFIVTFDRDKPYAGSHKNFTEQIRLVQLSTVPPGFNHKDHNDRIEAALSGIPEYFEGDLLPTGEPVTDKNLFDLNLRGLPEKDELLNRIEWENKRGSSDQHDYSSRYGGSNARLLTLLRRGGDREKILALRYLTVEGDSQCAEVSGITKAVLTAMSHKSAAVRRAAARCLTRLGSRSVHCDEKKNMIKELFARVDDEDPGVRYNTIGVIGLLGLLADHDSRIPDVLMHSLSDEDPWVRMNAVRQLGRMRYGQAIDSMIRLLDDDPSPTHFIVQEEIVMAIRYMFSDAAALRINTFTNPEERRKIHHGNTIVNWVRAEGPNAIVSADVDARGRPLYPRNLSHLSDNKQSDEKITDIISILAGRANNPYLKKEIVITFGELRAVEATESVVKAADDEDAVVRSEALKALSLLYATEPARSNIVDQDREDVIKETWPLGSTEEEMSAWRAKVAGQNERLLGVFLRAVNDGNPEVRLHAVDALGRSRDSRALPALLRALQDADARIVATAVAALGHLRDERILQKLAPLLSMPGSNDAFTAQLMSSFYQVARGTRKGTVYVYLKDGKRHVAADRQDIPASLRVEMRIVHPEAVGLLLGAFRKATPLRRRSLSAVLAKFEDARIAEAIGAKEAVKAAEGGTSSSPL